MKVEAVAYLSVEQKLLFHSNYQFSWIVSLFLFVSSPQLKLDINHIFVSNPFHLLPFIPNPFSFKRLSQLVPKSLKLFPLRVHQGP